MKKLILAAALACAPVAASANIIVPTDNQQITEEELAQRAQVCAMLFTSKVTADEVIVVYNLDTERKRRDFVLMCKMLELGYTIKAIEENNRKNSI